MYGCRERSGRQANGERQLDSMRSVLTRTDCFKRLAQSATVDKRPVGERRSGKLRGYEGRLKETALIPLSQAKRRGPLSKPENGDMAKKKKNREKKKKKSEFFGL